MAGARQHGIDFIRKYGFDDDGRMFFSVMRDGKPLRKRRYIFSESYTVAAFAAYAKASGETQAKEEALSVFRLMQRYLSEPGLLPPKIIPETSSMKGLAIPMIQIVTAQILREVLDDPQECNQVIDDAISEIERDFMKTEFKAVLEAVTQTGEFSDHFDGRMLCPGHAIEAAWFILKESIFLNHDPRLLKLGLTILDWMFEWGWDQEYGGILYYRDVKWLPVQEYCQDMKFGCTTRRSSPLCWHTLSPKTRNMLSDTNVFMTGPTSISMNPNIVSGLATFSVTTAFPLRSMTTSGNDF